MATIEGSLSKWTNVMKGWQFRWFVLDDNAGLLSYYTSKEKMMRGVRRGCVRLKGAVIGIDDEDDSTFTITVDGKTFHFQAKDADEREKWIRGLEDTILRHAHRMRWDPNRPTPSIQDFDKKLSEADAYLQIIIDQVKALDVRLSNINDLADRTRCEMIRDHANDMLESIKHSIVLLQIAKNTAHPVNGIYQGSTSYSTEVSRQGSIKGSPSPSGAVGHININEVQTGIEVGAECLEGSRRMPRVTLQGIESTNVSSVGGSAVVGGGGGGGGHRASMTLIVPDTSYSSSEEEDFYDANEYNETPSSTTSHGHRSFADAVGHEERDNASSTAIIANPVQGIRIQARNSIIDSRLPLLEDGSIDYDALYDCDDEETDMGSMESHGNIVTHLLSQVKIGMDLTKVVLPTFILERRSLLEMYADYFAHPDIFVSIADYKDPKDRMVQVLRWYLSAYHAGRKSGVAKKPYNPILGEIFQCHWDVPSTSSTHSNSTSNNVASPSSTTTAAGATASTSSTSTSNNLVTDGPVPWCHQDQLTFISEQVSHHPPISAFYAEHYNNRISFCAHVWTKSKFLGLSIGVHNIGQGCVSLLNYDEEYIVTFPNGYGRSILTVPWIELGGTVTISCAKTGYSATIEFLTKPFYGGKKNRIVAEAFQPSDKKPFLTVSGEWNGSMEAKWTDGRIENFIDVNRLTIIKKKVRPISEQSENESRKLWKDVTVGLKYNDIDRATRAKYQVEQRQRDLAKERKDLGVKWDTKMFQEAGENWVYRHPLVQRLAGKVSSLTQNH